jgi:intracellular multiplication protein IcmG
MAEDQLNQKLSELESSQNRIQSQFDATANQLNAINNNLNELTAKMAEMSNVLSQYSAKVDAQSHVIEQMAAEAAAMKKVHARRVAYPKTSVPPVNFHIQAVIPGRAWLINDNGSTLTVREGTRVPGYGMVRLIDARQGRIVTSSGRVIRFSQEDS